ncbi:VOC family protein [Robiginitalea sp. IMCC43444]|uniref:VOC family protein n=1 Tax=Robiginitalea sp. IMCC43444 TaxID=3459121 RepID=UPI0040431FA0
MKQNMVTWFEIPVTDMQRAIKFYEAVFGVAIDLHQMGELEMGWFPSAEGKSGASGTLIRHPDWYFPSESKGPLLYFSSEDVNHELGRVEQAGGKIVVEKRQISPEYGFMGVFIDSEGNRIALHSSK